MELAGAIAFLTDPSKQATKPGLSRVRGLLRALGDPQDGMRFVHVAGTNGKGSTSAYLAAICRAAGLRTGVFASPAFETLQDSMTVDGHPIGKEDLIACTEQVQRAAGTVEAKEGDTPSAFEMQCAVALLFFARRACDICVLETGMGGRLDATNVIHPDICVITRIGFDHTEFLGDTLGEIAAEKAGIVKPGVRVVSWPQTREAMAVIEDVCEERDCPLTRADFPRLARWLPDMDALARKFTYKDQAYVTRMLGSCQAENASVAIEAAFALRRWGWSISDRAIHEGVASAFMPARFEVVSRAPLVIVDGAHNLQGTEALAASFSEAAQALDAPDLCAHIVMGVLTDKDFEGMIGAVLPFAASFTAYAPANKRALAAEDLARAMRRQASEGVPVCVAPDAQAAAAQALDAARSDGCVVAFGSLYSAASVRRAILSA